MRQPSVVGEILAGLLLGPTVLGAVAPSVHDALFPSSGPTAPVLGAIYQFGLIFLIFLVGGELSRAGTAAEHRTVVAVTLTGLVIPFGAGVLIVRFLDIDKLSGPSGSPVAFALVFGSAIAVTSIPVISRIMFDLGILGTPFARVVLSVAVLEDIALYVILAVILGLVQSRSGGDFGLWTLFGSDSVVLSAVYHVSVSVLFLGLCLAFGGKVFRALAHNRLNIIEQRSPVAFRIIFLLLGVLASVSLGINSVFGALMAGYSTARGDAEPGLAEGVDSRATWDVLKQFLLAFFVPAYFALVGVQLDLLHHLPLLFFLWFFAMASAVKLGAVWLGARVAGESGRSSLNLAVALNARGGPGIVLATVTFTAGIINEEFFTVLVLLSILTSQVAGTWLDLAFGGRRGRGVARTEQATAPVRTPRP
ncbi:MAG TPA: cation:proton antiporter [Streptosporangiaceae bacterium]|nr:cation:proton antiporter [Streptosporangiaceae bacterium]